MEPRRSRALSCAYFDAGACRSCTLLDVPYDDQLAGKQARARELLDPFGDIAWLPPVASAVGGFRTKAKMVVAGTTDAPTLGILDHDGRGVDLEGCPIVAPAITAVLPDLAAFITLARIVPYDVPARRGELKHLIVTASSRAELMVRFVLRSTESLPRLRKHLPALLERVPQAVVVTANLLPEHKAVLEGEEEIVLTERSTLELPTGDVTLELLPKSFVQTNEGIAAQLYRTGAAWAAESAPRTVWDLYCGVGGFALHVAALLAEEAAQSSPSSAEEAAQRPSRSPRPHLTGVELSPDAVESARRAASVAGVDAEFIAADATAWAREAGPRWSTHGEAGPRWSTHGEAGPRWSTHGEAGSRWSTHGEAGSRRSTHGEAVNGDRAPDLVIVNPPRRGIGPELAGWLESSGVPRVLYSSCNAVSLARDLAAMPSLRPVRAQLFDMFPHTTHFETLVLLERVASGT
ncbi:methyltransferase domain-containing protein [Gryllotalpicola ginsengisoli]|uniref:methyltransferase domain-containing protein n=1 Tax=Gryllotalpicola ginsengisoli TaxID=444608 RepID=UPI0003B347D7|nr:methyltransferase domain-containing protein [Gryllotalpicola ginsengisoli]